MKVTAVASGHSGCSHTPCCPDAEAPDHDAARVVSGHPEQGWSLLCNGVVLFEDLGELFPDGHAEQARRIPLQRLRTAALARRIAPVTAA
jgi:hypothetical protein